MRLREIFTVRNVLLVVAAVAVSLAANALLAHWLHAPDGTGLAMLIGFRPKALTLAELMAIVNPQEARQPEVVPGVLYSNRLYTSAATTRLTFYDGAAALALQNVNNGQLPSPQFFQIFQIFINVQRAPTRTAAVATPAGALNDLELLMKTNPSRFTLTISQKEQLNFPIDMAGPSGGSTGIISGTYTADIDLQQGNNGIPGHSPFQVNGMIVIPPQTDFVAALDWPAAVTLTADVNISVRMYGALYRRVL